MRPDDSKAPPSAASAGPSAGRTGSRRMLIIEDDPDMWPILERFSAEADPTLEVEFAGSADEAEARLESEVRYHVVLSDYCLPRPGAGVEVLERAARLQPQARVGLISALMGYQPKDTPYLSKPFTREHYRRFLRDLLDWPEPSPRSA